MIAEDVVVLRSCAAWWPDPIARRVLRVLNRLERLEAVNADLHRRASRLTCTCREDAA